MIVSLTLFKAKHFDPSSSYFALLQDVHVVAVPSQVKQFSRLLHLLQIPSYSFLVDTSAKYPMEHSVQKLDDVQA